MNELDENVRQNGFVGFAEVFLWRFYKESNSEIDVNVYRKLVELDTKLGVTASEQLSKCLFRTSKLEIIEVRFLQWFSLVQLYLISKHSKLLSFSHKTISSYFTKEVQFLILLYKRVTSVDIK